jgi:hypothetical protein
MCGRGAGGYMKMLLQRVQHIRELVVGGEDDQDPVGHQGVVGVLGELPELLAGQLERKFKW